MGWGGAGSWDVSTTWFLFFMRSWFVLMFYKQREVEEVDGEGSAAGSWTSGSVCIQTVLHSKLRLSVDVQTASM